MDAVTIAICKKYTDVSVNRCAQVTTGDLSLSTTLIYKDKWLDCHGQDVSRTDFADLFAQIGTAYGAGNGVDTFTLPDTEDLTTSDTARYNIYTGVSNAPLQLKCRAGAFSVSVAGFTNPVWKYKSAQKVGNTGQFTVTNDGDIVRLEGTATDASQITVNTSCKPFFATDLKDFQGNINYYLNLSSCPNITGDLSDLQGKISNHLDLWDCHNITGDLSDLRGNITEYLCLRGCTNITGDLSDLQGRVTYYLSLFGCTHITGDLADLGGNLTYYLSLYKCSDVTGDLADLQGKLTNHLNLCDCTNVTGDLADLEGNLTSFLDLSNCSNITGNLSDLQGKLDYYLRLWNCPNITGIYTPVANSNIKTIHLNGTGQISADVDATIIAVAANIAGTNTNGTLETNARTSASDSAVASLKAKGWTIRCGGVLQ